MGKKGGRGVEGGVCIEYVDRVEQFREHFEPGKPICPELATELGYRVWLMGNGRLRQDHFLLSGTDFIETSEVRYPGLSAHLGFMDEDDISDVELNEIYWSVFGREYERRDFIHSVPFEVFDEANYRVVPTPLGRRELHLRLIHPKHFSNINYGILKRVHVREIHKLVDSYARRIPD